MVTGRVLDELVTSVVLEAAGVECAVFEVDVCVLLAGISVDVVCKIVAVIVGWVSGRDPGTELQIS